MTGTVMEIGENFLVIDVRGLGYQVFTPRATRFTFGDAATLHTHLAVRENALDLYGFTDQDDLWLFERLIDLPKIGPKSALQIMTQADSDMIREATISNDPARLSKMSGIGKKSAEKIVAGLKDKFEGHVSTGMTDVTPTNEATDTIDALIALGYPPSEARRVVLEVLTEHPDPVSASEIVKISLRRLS